MVAFPSFTADESALFLYPRENWHHPNLKVVFDDKSEAVFARTETGRYIGIIVVIQGPTSVMNTVLTFLKARKCEVEPFDFTHPKIGSTLTVRYNSDTLPIPRKIQGSVKDWYEIELELREPFNL